MLDDIKRYFNRLQNRICLLLARGILKQIYNTSQTQKVKEVCLADETLAEVERFEEYGMATYPLVDAETFTAFLNGNRNQGIVLCVHDRRYRPDYLDSGDVVLYTNADDTAQLYHRIWLDSSSRTIIINGATINITGDVSVTGDITDNQGIAQSMADMRTVFNNHVHPTAALGAPSPPTPPGM